MVPEIFEAPITELTFTKTFKNLFVWRMGTTKELVQWYQLADNAHDVPTFLWIEGSKRLAYRVLGGLELYGFETNL